MRPFDAFHAHPRGCRLGRGVGGAVEEGVYGSSARWFISSGTPTQGPEGGGSHHVSRNTARGKRGKSWKSVPPAPPAADVATFSGALRPPPSRLLPLSRRSDTPPLRTACQGHTTPAPRGQNRLCRGLYHSLERAQRPPTPAQQDRLPPLNRGTPGIHINRQERGG